jgi:CelD/BcsL family acetyltransferase involved in cellulose biosynthesis
VQATRKTKAQAAVTNQMAGVDVHCASAWPPIAPLWSELAGSSPHSFFLTREWIGCWLEVFASVLAPEILIFRSGSMVVGACLLVCRNEWRGPFRLRRIYLNTAGEDEADQTCISYNNILCRPGWEETVALALREHLDRRPWDEFVANDFETGPMLDAIRSVFADTTVGTSSRNSYYVDLNRLRQSNSQYEEALSYNTRRQVRRSFRMYGESGQVKTERAEDTSCALSMLDDLAALHEQSWIARGHPGAFASPRFFAFHRALVQRCFPLGMVQLLRVTASQKTIGMLYDFTYNGKAYSYQSGLRYSDDNRLKPGLVTHACAVHHWLEQGMREYDFLGAEARYKASLSTDSRQLNWLVFRKRTLKLHLIESLRFLRRMLKRRQPTNADSPKKQAPAKETESE